MRPQGTHSRQVGLTMNLQSLYKSVIQALQIRFTLNKEQNMKKREGTKGRGDFRLVAMAGFILFSLLPSPITPHAHAWTWDDDEAGTKDELDIQVEGYRKRVEQGISMQERIVMLDRLIKLFKVRKRDSKPLEDERAQVLADEQAVQNVSAASRQKAQTLFQQAFELVKQGNYKQADDTFLESERLNSTDKSVTELRQKMDGVVAVMPTAPPAETPAGDFIRKGVMQFMQNEPSKALNFLLYAQQKDADNAAIPALVDLVKRTFPNESSEILDARLNLIDQKLQKALEKIYSGEYLVAAKECQEVLDLEPENPLALTRLGSVYYAMGQVKQAREFWKQALQQDANNDVLKSFMSQTAAEADRAPAQALTYKVQKGDTLMTIAERVYKDKNLWKKLYEANKAYMKNPYALSVGQVLVLPPGGVTP
jgi:tetratricopeptide (TPR) repeat protein